MSVIPHYEVTTHPTSDRWLMLVHGLFGDGKNLSMIKRHFEASMNVINVDLPNHGLSPHLADFTLDHARMALLHVLDELSLKSVSILGHSLGGKVAMFTALHHPERFTHLIAADIAPAVYEPRHSPVFAGLNNVPLHAIETRNDADKALSQYVKETGVRQFLLKSLFRDDSGRWSWRFNLEGLQASYHNLIDWPVTNKQFNKPVLFIKGGLSDYITLSHQAQITALFPNASAKIIEGTGHWLHAEKPQSFNRIVEKFLTAS